MTAACDDPGTRHRRYGAYGQAIAPAGSARTAFAGEILDVVFGGYVLGVRTYLPRLRHFMSPDSASPFDGGGVNRYAYCLGDPINRIDPSGNASFGWLGKLLGRLGATIGRTVDAVSQLTPTTALTTIGATANIVFAATAIGAATAITLDEAPAAGILGWIALGSGAAGLGLGAAGYGLGKHHGIADVSPDRGGNRYRPKAPQGMMKKSWGGGDYERKTFPLDGGRQIKRYAGIAAVEKLIPHRKAGNGINSLMEPIPEWNDIPNRAGGINWVVDSSINTLDELDLMEIVRRNYGDTKKFIYLTGVHGSSDGINWNGKRRLHGYPDALRYATEDREQLAGLAGVKGSDIAIVDLSKIDADRFIRIMDMDAHIIHAYCYSAVDRILMTHLGIRDRTMRIYLRT